MQDIAQLDEKSAVFGTFKPVGEVLPELVLDCAASVKNDLGKLSGLSERQRDRIMAYLTNMYMATEWKKSRPVKGWNVDDTGFFHLYSVNTFMSARFHAVDPITRGMPKANHTLADKARYSQSAGKQRGELSLNVFGYPDLSDVYLTIACDYLFPKAGFLRAYKPMSKGGYGVSGRVAYSFPILNDWRDGESHGYSNGFDPTPETDVDVLSGLLVEEKMQL